MSVNKFKPRKYEDHEIVNARGAKVGDIRVKPSGVLWSPKGEHIWYGVKIDAFAKLMEENGNKQKK